MAVRDAGAGTLISKETFLGALPFARTPSSCTIFLRATKKCIKARRMFNCLWNLNGEITQLLKRHVCAGSFVLFCSLTRTFFCLLLVLSFRLTFLSLFSFSIAGGSRSGPEWLVAVIQWSKAGRWHLPDCEAAVVEGSTGGWTGHLGEKTSRAGELRYDCMSLAVVIPSQPKPPSPWKRPPRKP